MKIPHVCQLSLIELCQITKLVLSNISTHHSPSPKNLHLKINVEQFLWPNFQWTILFLLSWFVFSLIRVTPQRLNRSCSQLEKGLHHWCFLIHFENFFRTARRPPDYCQLYWRPLEAGGFSSVLLPTHLLLL